MSDSLSVAILEPYYGGSHASFVDTLAKYSRHRLIVAKMSARKWKWRMRGAAIWFARDDHAWQQGAEGRGVDAILCNDMLSASDLRSLLPARMRSTPIICYFHENQLTYPLSQEDERDFQYGMTNITSCLASDAVWFNSAFHRDDFLHAAGALLRKMPDHLPSDVIEDIRRKSAVHPPPVEFPIMPEPRERTGAGVTRILWSHRWEYDKNPKPFFEALIELHDRGATFELVLLGEQFRTAPPVFQNSWPRLQPHIVHAGFVPDRAAYWRLLANCDLVVSSAIQENFGISVVEAVLAGCRPLLPNRLSYPELIPPELRSLYLYPDDPSLGKALESLVRNGTDLDGPQRSELRRSMHARFDAASVVPQTDEAITAIGG